MNKDKLLAKHYAITIAILLMVIVSLSIYFVYLQYQDNQGKSAPIVAEVKEQLDQARAMQKQGALEESVDIFEHYALQGYPDAMFFFARAYERGWGVPPDLDKARSYLLNAVQYNFSYRGESAFQIGRLFQKSAGPNCNTIAVDWFKKALQWNYVKASLLLGIHYEKGLGVEQNLNKAIFYYEIAVQEGIAIAALKHARLIVTGKYGYTKDLEYGERLISFAIERLEKDANNGKASAAKTLGRLYRDGRLVNLGSKEKNNITAIYWLQLASDLGDAGAMHDLGRLLIFIDEIKNHKQAIALLKKSALKGHGGAATTLGRMHIQQKYGLNSKGAIAWFEQGVNAGHTGAMKELAIVYHDGELASKSLVKAIVLLQKASNKGHTASKRLLNKYLKKQRKLKKMKSKKVEHYESEIAFNS